VETEDYLSKISGLAEEINCRFHDLRSLKSSFSFLENSFAVDVVGDGCPVFIANSKGYSSCKVGATRTARAKRTEKTQKKWRFYHRIFGKIFHKKNTNKRVC